MIGKFLRAGLQSGTIMGMADVSTQILIEGKRIPTAATTTNIGAGKGHADDSDSDHSYDVLRSLRWGFLGLVLHGPYFLAGFSMLDKRLQGTGWTMVAKKTATAQFTLFPPYLCLLFGALGVLEHHPDIPAKIAQRVPEAFVSGCVYWPVANGINFKLVPNNLRVPYLALSAGVWNSYLSYTNQNGGTRNGN